MNCSFKQTKIHVYNLNTYMYDQVVMGAKIDIFVFKPSKQLISSKEIKTEHEYMIISTPPQFSIFHGHCANRDWDVKL